MGFVERFRSLLTGLVLAGASAAAATHPGPARAQSAPDAAAYPSRAVTLVVPFDAGSATDVVARTLQPHVTAALGQPVVVVNRAGASGTIGAGEVAQARPDGHTVGLLGMAGLVLLPHARRLAFELGSFDFLCQVYSAPVVAMVAPNSPHRTIRDLIAFGRANPEQVFYGSPGIGTPDHVNTASFLRANGVTGTHVPFGGGGAATTALLGGQITLFANTTVVLRAHNLRPLAVLVPRRLPDLPEVPAAGEFGPAFDATIWAVLAAPRGLPAEVRARLTAACRQVLETPPYREAATRAGFPPLFRDGAAFDPFVRAEFARYGTQMRQEGLELR
jgi:tripartite-type tricarboxylate transporter receptor subunit TctC